MDEPSPPIAWEAELAALLAELSDIQSELLTVLADKRHLLLSTPLESMAAVQLREADLIARLQAATSSARPILLRTSSSSGHGFGTALDERIEEDADVFSFLFDQLGIQYAAK